MHEALDRSQLIVLVERIRQSEGTEDEIDQWIDAVERNIPAPTGYVTDLIFWSSDYGYAGEPSATEIVDKALSYKPIRL